MSGGYKPVEHTSDIGIKVWGSSIKELFEEAAKGMIAQLYDHTRVQEKEILELNLEAESIDELLLQWLKEILFLNESKGFLFCRFQIERDNFSLRNAKTAQIRASLYGGEEGFHKA